MARRPTTPARRKRRTAVCAVLLPLLLAALLLVLDVPFLTARGALAATQERYAFGPGEVIARFSPQQEGMPPLRYYIVRDGDWFAWCSVERDGLFWRPGALTAACPDGEAPLAILASPTFGGTSPELVVVSSDPDIAAVELNYLVKSAIIDTVVYVHVEMARQESLEDSCFYFSLEDAYSRLFYETPSTVFRVRGYDAAGRLLYESPYPARWLEYSLLDSHLKVVTP